MQEKSRQRKDFIWNTIGTTFNAFNSLFFLMFITRINGLNDAGIFTFGFSMACLFYIIGIYSGRVFQVTDVDEENDDYSYINMHFVTVGIMIFLSLVFCLVRRYQIYKFSIVMLLILYKALEAMSDTFYAIIQKNDELYKVGISLFFKAILGVLFFLLVDIYTKNLIISVFSIVFINFIVLLFYDIRQSKLTFNNGIKFNFGKIEKLLKVGFYTFAFTFLNLYLVNISKYIIDFSMEDKFQTIFGIIIMPATVIALFAQFIIHPFLLSIKYYIKKCDYKDLRVLIFKLTVAIVFFGAFSIICAWFLGVPVLNFIYGIRLDNYRVDLIVILIGAIFYALLAVYSNVLIAFRKTFSQALVYLIVSIISTFITYLLISSFKLFGASLAYAFTMFSICTILVLISGYVINTKKKEV